MNLTRECLDDESNYFDCTLWMPLHCENCAAESELKKVPYEYITVYFNHEEGVRLNQLMIRTWNEKTFSLPVNVDRTFGEGSSRNVAILRLLPFILAAPVTFKSNLTQPTHTNVDWRRNCCRFSIKTGEIADRVCMPAIEQCCLAPSYEKEWRCHCVTALTWGCTKPLRVYLDNWEREPITMLNKTPLREVSELPAPDNSRRGFLGKGQIGPYTKRDAQAHSRLVNAVVNSVLPIGDGNGEDKMTDSERMELLREIDKQIDNTCIEHGNLIVDLVEEMWTGLTRAFTASELLQHVKVFTRYCFDMITYQGPCGEAANSHEERKPIVENKQSAAKEEVKEGAQSNAHAEVKNEIVVPKIPKEKLTYPTNEVILADWIMDTNRVPMLDVLPSMKGKEVEGSARLNIRNKQHYDFGHELHPDMVWVDGVDLPEEVKTLPCTIVGSCGEVIGPPLAPAFGWNLKSQNVVVAAHEKRCKFGNTFENGQVYQRYLNFVDAAKAKLFTPKAIQKALMDSDCLSMLKSNKMSLTKFKTAVAECVNMTRTDGVKSFIKNEFNSKPRIIMNEGPERCVAQLLLIHVFEHILFEKFKGRHIKYEARGSALNKIFRRFSYFGDNLKTVMDGKALQLRAVEIDQSSFDQHEAEQIMVPEVGLLQHIAQHLQNQVDSTMTDVVLQQKQENTRLIFPLKDNTVTISFPSRIRHSGERGTSCLNFFTEMGATLSCMFLDPERVFDFEYKEEWTPMALHVGGLNNKSKPAYVDFAFEGDDALLVVESIVVDENVPEIQENFTKMGMDVKLKVIQDGRAEFVGTHVALRGGRPRWIGGKKGQKRSIMWCPDIMRNLEKIGYTVNGTTPQEFYTNMLSRAASFAGRCNPLAEYCLGIAVALRERMHLTKLQDFSEINFDRFGQYLSREERLLDVTAIESQIQRGLERTDVISVAGSTKEKTSKKGVTRKYVDMYNTQAEMLGISLEVEDKTWQTQIKLWDELNAINFQKAGVELKANAYLLGTKGRLKKISDNCSQAGGSEVGSWVSFKSLTMDPTLDIQKDVNNAFVSSWLGLSNPTAPGPSAAGSGESV